MQIWLPNFDGVSLWSWWESAESSVSDLSENLKSSVVPWIPVCLFSLFWFLVESVTSAWQSLTHNLSVLGESFSFDDFQIKFIQALFLVLFCNICLTLLAWRVYGKKITERFMQTSSDVLKEQLKTAVSELKLPNEHTPRL